MGHSGSAIGRGGGDDGASGRGGASSRGGASGRGASSRGGGASRRGTASVVEVVEEEDHIAVATLGVSMDTLMLFRFLMAHPDVRSASTNSRARTCPFYTLPSRLKDYKETESKICVHEYCIPLTTMEIINYKSYRWKESIFLQHLFCSSTIGFAISHG